MTFEECITDNIGDFLYGSRNPYIKNAADIMKLQMFANTANLRLKHLKVCGIRQRIFTQTYPICILLGLDESFRGGWYKNRTFNLNLDWKTYIFKKVFNMNGKFWVIGYNPSNGIIDFDGLDNYYMESNRKELDNDFNKVKFFLEKIIRYGR